MTQYARSSGKISTAVAVARRFENLCESTADEVFCWLSRIAVSSKASKSAAEARAALAAATRILERLGVRLYPQKTRIVHIQQGFLSFWDTEWCEPAGKARFPAALVSAMEPKRADRISHTQINPTIPGSGADVDATQCSAKDSGADRRAESDPARLGRVLQRAHVRTLFHKLDDWIVRRIWSHRFCRWRTRGWIQLPKAKLYAEFGLVNLISLIPSLGSPPFSPVHERLRESCMPETGTYSPAADGG